MNVDAGIADPGAGERLREACDLGPAPALSAAATIDKPRAALADLDREGGDFGRQVPERRGEVLGWVQSSGAMARIVGPVSAGILFDAVGPGAPFLVGAVFYGVALAVVAGIDRQ